MLSLLVAFIVAAGPTTAATHQIMDVCVVLDETIQHAVARSEDPLHLCLLGETARCVLLERLTDVIESHRYLTVFVDERVEECHVVVYHVVWLHCVAHLAVH